MISFGFQVTSVLVSLVGQVSTVISTSMNASLPHVHMEEHVLIWLMGISVTAGQVLQVGILHLSSILFLFFSLFLFLPLSSSILLPILLLPSPILLIFLVPPPHPHPPLPASPSPLWTNRKILTEGFRWYIHVDMFPVSTNTGHIVVECLMSACIRCKVYI